MDQNAINSIWKMDNGFCCFRLSNSTSTPATANIFIVDQQRPNEKNIISSSRKMFQAISSGNCLRASHTAGIQQLSIIKDCNEANAQIILLNALYLHLYKKNFTQIR